MGTRMTSLYKIICYFSPPQRTSECNDYKEVANRKEPLHGEFLLFLLTVPTQVIISDQHIHHPSLEEEITPTKGLGASADSQSTQRLW